MVPDAFRAGALDNAPAVHPNAPVSDLPGLDGHRRTWPHSRCELLAGIADDCMSGVLPGLDPGPPELVATSFVVAHHELAAGRQVAVQEPGSGFRQGFLRMVEGVNQSAELRDVVPTRLLEAEHRIARLGDEILPAHVPAGRRADRKPILDVFAWRRIVFQPNDGKGAAPVRDAVCIVQIAA